MFIAILIVMVAICYIMYVLEKQYKAARSKFSDDA